MEKLITMIKDNSIDRFKSHMKYNDVSIEIPNDKNLNKVRSFRTVIILVSGDDLKLIFKVHFTSEIANYFYQNAMQKTPAAVEKSIDFMKEYTNVVAGRIKKFFTDQNVNVGISLPILTRGFDEIFFELPKINDAIVENWIIKAEKYHLCCTGIIELLNPNVVSRLKYSVPEQTDNGDEGEVNFL
ncbi:MAG: chemotaxis protein CheX [Oligoflexia bacterium]|nr:chemotaxis protein CheX [Oligoflexia bacterium]